MKFKLDENLGRSVLALCEADGHETSSVHLAGLDTSPDERVFSVCLSEERVLVTLDLDFANPLRFDPRPTVGRDVEGIVEFLIVDNGVGFDDANMASFETLDGDCKADQGCRGVGRLLWSKCPSHSGEDHLTTVLVHEGSDVIGIAGQHDR